MEQGTEEWKLARLGKVTASRVSAARAKKGTAARADYIADIITERLTGSPIESYTNAYMEWGTANEPLARAAYEIKTGVWVEQTGLVDHPTILNFAASPDGLIGDDGLIEIKCPAKTSTHISYLTAKEVPSGYKHQMLAQMACTGRRWVDFVSFDPRLPERLQLFVVRFEPSEEDIKNLETDVVNFLTEVDNLMERL
jgi:putative phage-type endonuclease